MIVNPEVLMQSCLIMISKIRMQLAFDGFGTGSSSLTYNKWIRLLKNRNDFMAFRKIKNHSI
ncbi:hypothetical protein EU508_11370 [Pseudoalteromonas fuliginea]|uniref:EAL domain-containing protein n=1 Tax=Pseudoalteromonas fuliginea TaxID=1872678 RepID=A0AB73BFT2_9GAMM|nr:hypothetical protein EU508_11370 [Pseudoalteromonas fuliginea]